MTMELVVVIDLRDIPAHEPVDVDAHQRAAIAAHRGPVHAGRILVLDTLSAVGGRGEQLRALIDQSGVHSVLVLLTGNEEGNGFVGAMPDALVRESRNCGVIWVGDQRGIDWDGISKREAVFVSDPDDLAGTRNWEALFDALTLPRVFDECLRALREPALPVGTPGLRIIRAGGRGLQPALQTLALRGVRTLADGEPTLEALEPDDELDRLLGGAAPPLDPFDDEHGVGAALRSAEQACQDADEAVRSVRVGAFTTSGADDALAAVEQLARAIEELDRRWQSTIGAVDSSDGVDVRELALLERAKVRVVVPTDGLLKLATSRLRETVTATLTRTQSFEAAAHVAGQVERRATPQDQGTIMHRIHQMGLTESGEELHDVALPREGLDLPTVLSLTAVALVTSALAPHGSTSVAIALMAVGVVALARICYVTRFPRRPWVNGGVTALVMLFLLLWGVAAIGARSPVPTNAVLVAFAVGLGGLAAWQILVAKRRRVFAAWKASLPLSRVSQKLECFRRDVPSIVLNELVLANLRRSLAELASTLRVIMDQMAAACRQAAMPDDPDGGSLGSVIQSPLPNIDSFINEHLDELTAVVKRDALGVAQDTLDALWPAVLAGTTLEELNVEKRVAHDLNGYIDHLFRRGPLVSPGTEAMPSEARSQLIRRIWTRALSDEAVMRVGDSACLLQMCRPSQLVFVDTSSPAPVIRFVPAQVPPEIAPSAVRTEAGDLGGAIRVAPLVPAAIRVV